MCVCIYVFRESADNVMFGKGHDNISRMYDYKCMYTHTKHTHVHVQAIKVVKPSDRIPHEPICDQRYSISQLYESDQIHHSAPVNPCHLDAVPIIPFHHHGFLEETPTKTTQICWNLYVTHTKRLFQSSTTCCNQQTLGSVVLWLSQMNICNKWNKPLDVNHEQQLGNCGW